MNFEHYSVMLKECIDGLNIKPNGLYVDCTAGGGGHSYAIAERLTEGGKLIAIDRDPEAIAAVTDAQLALALVTALGEPEKHKAVLEVLTAKAEKARKRQAENKAHQRNLRKGKKK